MGQFLLLTVSACWSAPVAACVWSSTLGLVHLLPKESEVPTWNMLR